MGQKMFNKFGSKFSAISAQNATFTASPVTDSVTNPDGYLITAATVPVVMTLPSPQVFATLRIINSASSVNIVVLSGTLVGNTILLPGQSATLWSNETSWYNSDPASATSVSVAISSANFLALNSTPKSLVPSPGSGYIVRPEYFLFTMTRTSTAYTSGGALEFRYTNASGAKVAADIAATVVTDGGAGVELNSVGGIVSSITPVANAAITLNSASANFASGTGTAVMRVVYRVIPSP
jgi:hypothetical protein